MKEILTLLASRRFWGWEARAKPGGPLLPSAPRL